jgi:hypothetical protein
MIGAYVCSMLLEGRGKYTFLLNLNKTYQMSSCQLFNEHLVPKKQLNTEFVNIVDTYLSTFLTFIFYTAC